MSLPLLDLFGVPLAGVLLPVVVAAGWLWLRHERRRTRRLHELVGPRARVLAGEHSPARARFRVQLCTAGLLLGVFACMQPRFGQGPSRVLPPGADLCICLDVSRSMLARDVQPSRLLAAQQAIADLASRTRGDRLGLVVFAGEARLRVPLTRDAASFVEIVRGTDPGDVAVGGTDLGAAIDAAVTALARAQGLGPDPADDAPLRGAVLLVTDGEDPSGTGRAAAERAHQRGLRVHCTGFGSALGSKITIQGADGRETFLRDRGGNEVVSRLDATSLRSLAAAGGGRYVDGGSSAAPLVELYERSIVPELDAAPAGDVADGRANRFQLPLAIGVLLLLLDLLLPQRQRRREARPPVPAAVAAGGEA